MAVEKAVLQAAVPILAVYDLTAALDYYERVLGFQIGWKWGEPPSLASVWRDGVELNLSQPGDRRPVVSQVYFHMIGVDAYYSRIAGAGAKVAVALGDRPYGNEGLSARRSERQ